MRIKKFLKFGILTLGLAVATTTLASCSFSDWFFGNNDNNISERQYDVERTITVLSTLEKAEDFNYFLDKLNYGDDFITDYEIIKDTYTDAYYEIGKQKTIDANLTLKDGRKISVHFNIDLKSVEQNSELICGKNEISISPFKYDTADDFVEDKYFGINTNGGVYVSKGVVSTEDNFDVNKLGTYNVTLKYGSYNKKVKVVVEYQTYKLTFNDANGNPLKVVNYNEEKRDASSLAPRVADLNIPKVELEKQNTEEYVFDGWDKDLTNILEDCTINPIIKRTDKLYTVTFKNYDGTILDQVKCKYGSNIPYLKENPIREGNEYLSYKFIGWTIDTSRIIGNTTTIARFKETRKSGTRVYSYCGRVYGQSQIENDTEFLTNPIETPEFNKEIDTQYDPCYEYEFKNWEYDYTSSDSSTEYYKPHFTSTKTKVKLEFKQLDGTIIETKYVNIGSTLNPKDIEKIENDITRPIPTEYPELYSYILKGWNYNLEEEQFYDRSITPVFELEKLKSYVKIYSPNSNTPFEKVIVDIGKNVYSQIIAKIPDYTNGVNYTKEPYSNYCVLGTDGVYYIATKFVDMKGNDLKPEMIIDENDLEIKIYLEPYINKNLNLEYTSNNVCSITSNISLEAENLYIPTYSIDGKKIVSFKTSTLNNCGFKNNTTIQNVYWNNTAITAFPEYSFALTGIKTFTLGKDSAIKTFNENSFYNSSIEEFKVGDGVYTNSTVETIDDLAFSNCKNLKNIHLNEMVGLRNIGKKAFAEDTELKYFGSNQNSELILLTTQSVNIEENAFKNTKLSALSIRNSDSVNLEPYIFNGIKNQITLKLKNENVCKIQDTTLYTGTRDSNGIPYTVTVVYYDEITD